MIRLNPALWILVGLLFVALAGCANGSRPQPPTSGIISSTSVGSTGQASTSSKSPSDSMTSAPIPRSISWNECKGTESSITFGETLFSMNHGEAPPGWEPQLGDDTNYLFTINTCQRVSVGNLERGPASFMVEMYWGLRPPESCGDFEPGYDDVAALLSLWVDDPMVAAVLRDQLQMPVQLATIHVETMPQAGAESQTWTWKAEGGEESKLTVVNPGGSETRGTPVDRLVWHNGTGVRFFDLENDRSTLDVPFPATQGVLAPPMRYASTGESTPFVGGSAVWNQGDFFGPVYRFGDMECKQLLG